MYRWILRDDAHGFNFRSSGVSADTSAGEPRCGCTLCRSDSSRISGPSNLVGSGPNGDNTYNLPSLTWDEAAAQIWRNTSYFWRNTDTSGTTVVTYAYRSTQGSNTAGGEIINFTPFSAAQIAATESAIALWESVADIDFVRVDDGDGYSDDAAILFGSYDNSGPDRRFAFAYYPSSGNESPTSSQGDVWTNISYSSNLAVDPGEYGYLTLIHEIGHAIGLRHPGNYDASNGSSSYEDDAEYFEDTRQYSVMSYFDETFSGANWGSLYSSTPMMHDIATAQLIYGANTNLHGGNSRYGFQPTSDQSVLRLLSGSDQAAVTIVDSGGFDWFNFQNYSDDAVIDLREEAWSSVGGLTYNVGIARGTIIEGVRAGSGNDIVFGNDENNRFWGNEGDDKLTGFDGQDTAYFDGDFADYTITRLATGGFTVTDNVGTDGTDTLYNIRYARFANRNFDMVRGVTGNRKVDITATLAEIDIDADGLIRVGDYFEVSDPDLDTILLYRFRYSSGDAGEARVGDTVLDAEVWHILSADEFADLHFAGTYEGPDGAGDYANRTQMILRAYDGGVGWSATGRYWVNVQDLPANSAPVLQRTTNGSHQLGYGRLTSVVDLFRFIDADGDGPVSVRVRDNTPGGAAVFLSDTVLAEGVWHEIGANDLNSLSFLGGQNSLDEFEVQMSDGRDWSNTVVEFLSGPADDHGGSLYIHSSIALGQTVSGIIEYRLDNDWFGFDVSEIEELEFILTPSTGHDPSDVMHITIYDSEGVEVNFSEATLSDGSTRAVFTPQSTGEYYVVAWGTDPSSSGYNLTFRNRENAAPQVGRNTTLYTFIGSGPELGRNLEIEDPDGDTIIEYRVQDLSDDGAYLELAGVPLNALIEHTISSDDFGQLVVVGEMSGGLDFFRVSVSDGSDWSDSFDIRTVNFDVETSDHNTSTSLTVNSAPLASFIDADGDTDWFRVSLVSGQNYRVEASGTDTNVNRSLNNIVVSMYDASGSLLKSGQTSSSEPTDFLNFLATSTGEYFVVIEADQDAPSDKPNARRSYHVEISEYDNSPPVISARSFESVLDLGINATQGFSEVWRFVSAIDPEGEQVSQYKVRDLSIDNAHIKTGDGTYIGSTWETMTREEFLQLRFVVDGSLSTSSVFEFQAFADGDWSDIAQLSISLNDLFGATVANAGAISVGETRQETFETAADDDWFAVQLTEGVTYEVTGLGSTGPNNSGSVNLQLYVYDPEGNLLVETAATSARSFAFTPGESGTFYLAAGIYSTRNAPYGNYTLTIQEQSNTSASTTTRSNPAADWIGRIDPGHYSAALSRNTPSEITARNERRDLYQLA